jgi:hypothetical protein
MVPPVTGQLIFFTTFKNLIKKALLSAFLRLLAFVSVSLDALVGQMAQNLRG